MKVKLEIDFNRPIAEQYRVAPPNATEVYITWDIDPEFLTTEMLGDVLAAVPPHVTSVKLGGFLWTLEDGLATALSRLPPSVSSVGLSSSLPAVLSDLIMEYSTIPTWRQRLRETTNARPTEDDPNNENNLGTMPLR